MVCTDIMICIFLALVLLIITSFVIYRNTHVIEPYRKFQNGYFHLMFKRKKKRRGRKSKKAGKAASKVAAALTNANYYDFDFNYDFKKRYYQGLYPDLGQTKQIGILTHESPLQDEGGNSWMVYGTREFGYIKHNETHYEFNVYWRDLYIVPTNEIYRGNLFKYGTGPENNRISINADTLDMNIDLRFLKAVPSQIRFRHPALHTTPYTFISLEK